MPVYFVPRDAFDIIIGMHRTAVKPAYIAEYTVNFTVFISVSILIPIYAAVI